MGIFDLFRSKRSIRKIASFYTDVQLSGFAFYIKGRLVNLYQAKNPKGEIEYFVTDREICWNMMCTITRYNKTFRPDPHEFVLKEVDLSRVYEPAKDVKLAWLFYTLA